MGQIGQREWDAETYHEVSDPQVEWARDVLTRVDLDGDERALDAGCGAGRVTRLLLERLPRGHVLAVDASQQMLERASELLADASDRVTFHRSDLTELVVDEPVDFVFSNAVFHWIPDHDALFGRLAGALTPGGRLLAQCGGAGNIAGVIDAIKVVCAREPFAQHLAGFARDWHFAGPEETRARLERAGFDEVETSLEPRPVRLATGGPAERFLSTVVLRLHMEALPEDLRGPLARAVASERADEDGIATLDYVRLNMSGSRA